jgi:PTS system nitrogen regulatory IIA component
VPAGAVPVARVSGWLPAKAVLLDVPATSLAGAVAVAVPRLTELTGLETSAIAQPLEEATRESDFAIGGGIAVPHASISGLSAPAVVFVRLARPIDIGAMDRMPADLIFVTLFPAGDAAAHLKFLAHLAQLAHSRVLREGLRTAADAAAVIELVEAAESRRAVSPRAPTRTPAAETYLAMIALAGEKAVDAVLVELLDCGLGDATILDAQSASEAASREVPLFAGFQDIFGDPGGRRVILAVVSADQLDEVSALVGRVCDEREAASGEVWFMPLASRWKWTRTDEAAPARGH